jgi:hypothetical protein
MIPNAVPNIAIEASVTTPAVLAIPTAVFISAPDSAAKCRLFLQDIPFLIMNDNRNTFIVNQPRPPTNISKNRIICPHILNCSTIVTVVSPVSENADDDMNKASINEIASAPSTCVAGHHNNAPPTNENVRYHIIILKTTVILLNMKL